jgi:chemotaxis protein MotB
MARKKKHEEHVNAEAWAIPYGDLITLLLAFFVVMYSMSSVNEGKFRILSDSLVAAFRGAPSTVAPVNIGESKPVGKGGDAKLDGVAPTTLIRLKNKNDPRSRLDRSAALQMLGVAEGGDSAGAGAGDGQGGAGARSALARMAGEVRIAMQNLIDDGDVRVRQTPQWLEVEIRTDILFGSGVAQVSDVAGPVVSKLSEILKPFPNPVRVEGHTDDRPIRTAVFPSNWELSAARAANVVHLMAAAGLAPDRMEVIGFGEHRPIAPNTTAEGRNRTRRVLIVVMEQQDANASGPVYPPPGRAAVAPLASAASARPGEQR